MKTALICMLQLHKNSGSARTAFENIRYFQSKGYVVHVASMTMDKETLQSMNVVPHKMLPWLKSTGITRRRFYNWQVQQLRKRLKPTITVGHGDIQEQDVLTLHNCVFYASELIHNKPLPDKHEMSLTHGPMLEKQTFHRMIANSKLMKEDTIMRFSVPANIIEVIYPALDTKTFFPLNKAEKAKQRERFNMTDKVVVSLITSGNFKKRGLDIFIEAIAALKPETKNKIDVRVIGKEEPGPFKDLIKSRKLDEIIKIQPSIDDIQNFYNAIDIFVLPARIEEFGRVVLEAMGSGLPVITTDKVGAGELLTGASLEFVIPSHKAEPLTEALEKLINDASLREKLGALNALLAQGEAESLLPPKFDRVFLQE